MASITAVAGTPIADTTTAASQTEQHPQRSVLYFIGLAPAFPQTGYAKSQRLHQ